MKDWQGYFLDVTLDWGYSYFLEKQVKNFKFQQNQITATVSNTQNYHVVIETTKNGRVEKMDCDCSCLSREQCPHLVAVLFEYNQHLLNKNINNITYLVSDASESQIRHFLKIILNENKQLAKSFQNYIYSTKQFDLKKNITKKGKLHIASPYKNKASSTLKHTKKRTHSLSVKQMSLLNYSKQKIRQTIQENWESPTVRTQYINFLLEKKLYEEAEEVLKESITLDSSLPHLVLLHRYSLKKLYHKLGRKEDYIKQTIQLLIENETVDMMLIHQLKKICTLSEWESIHKRLFKELRNHSGVSSLYAQEKRYDLLLDYVLETPGLAEVNRHFDLLKKQTPEALLQKYEYELRKMAHTTTTRPHYQKMALHIEKMATLPNSMISVQLLIKELKEKYPRRKAMIQVLNRLEKRI